MKTPSILLVTCLAASTLLCQPNLHSQPAPPPPVDSPTKSPETGAPPKFGPEDGPKRDRPRKRDPEERLARLKESLALTSDQETKIREIIKKEMENARAERQANKGNKPDPDARRTKMKAAREETEAAIKTVLTPEQQAKWETMKKDRKPRGPGADNDGEMKPGPDSPHGPESAEGGPKPE